jgi:hypothetical protein
LRFVHKPDGKVTVKYEKGFPLGFVGETQGWDAANVNNHVAILIKYHKDEQHFRVRLFVCSSA